MRATTAADDYEAPPVTRQDAYIRDRRNDRSTQSERVMAALGGPRPIGEDLRLAEMSDIDLRNALDAALRAAVTNYFTIVEVRPKSRIVVYTTGTPDGQTVHLQRSFDLENDAIVLQNDAVEVRPQTEYVPVESASRASSLRSDITRDVGLAVMQDRSAADEWTAPAPPDLVAHFQQQRARR